MLEPASSTRGCVHTMPEGFALDATHVPHITVLQRYVRTPELEQALDAMGAVVAGADLSTLILHATAIGHAEWDTPGVGIASLLLGRDPRLLALQGRLIAALAPFAAPEGTARLSSRIRRNPGQRDHGRLRRPLRARPLRLALPGPSLDRDGPAPRPGGLRGRAVRAVRRARRGRRRLPAREQRDGATTGCGRGRWPASPEAPRAGRETPRAGAASPPRPSAAQVFLWLSTASSRRTGPAGTRSRPGSASGPASAARTSRSASAASR